MEQKPKPRQPYVSVYADKWEIELWREAAEKGGRSLTRLIRHLMRDYCRGMGLDPDKPRREIKTKR